MFNKNIYSVVLSNNFFKINPYLGRKYLPFLDKLYYKMT